jgi:transcriptional regulator with XRE-family HTH domain
MKSTGKIIYEFRMKKGLSQEELAEMAKVNLRTIQRIENDLTEPRETTINLIFGVLEIDQNQLKPQTKGPGSNSLIQNSINAAFLVLLNVTVAAVLIYLTVYDGANTYTKIGAFLLCILFPYLILSQTRSSTAPKRLVKFGTGFMLLVVFLLFQVSVSKAVFSGAIPFSLLGLCILFYGNALLPTKSAL